MRTAKFLLSLWVALSLLIFVGAAFADAGDSALPDYITKNFADPDQFKPVETVGALPADILKMTGSLAEPGQPYQDTTVIANPPLPDGRLVWAAHRQEEYIIYYESGGYADGYKLLIANTASPAGPASMQWRGGIAHGRLKSFQAFLRTWKAGELVREWP
jgi:hypothetical protein